MSNGMTGWLGDRVASLVPAVLPTVTAHASSCNYVGTYHSPTSVHCPVVCCPNGCYYSSCY